MEEEEKDMASSASQNRAGIPSGLGCFASSHFVCTSLTQGDEA